MSDLRSILTGRSDNIAWVVDNRPQVDPDEPKVIRVVQVVDSD